MVSVPREQRRIRRRRSEAVVSWRTCNRVQKYFILVCIRMILCVMAPERFCIYTHAQASLAINAFICSMAMSAHSQPVSSYQDGTQRNREAAAKNTGLISAVCLVCLDRWTLDLRRHA